MTSIPSSSQETPEPESEGVHVPGQPNQASFLEGSPAEGASGAVNGAPAPPPQASNGSSPSAPAPPLPSVKREAMGKVGMWFAFAVLFAVLPTLGEFLSARQKNDHPDFEFFDLAARADLYVVAMGLAASALSQTLMRNKGTPTPPLLKFCGAVNILILALTALLAATSDGTDMNTETVGQQSFILLITTLISCGSSTYTCELENSHT